MEPGSPLFRRGIPEEASSLPLRSLSASDPSQLTRISFSSRSFICSTYSSSDTRFHRYLPTVILQSLRVFCRFLATLTFRLFAAVHSHRRRSSCTYTTTESFVDGQRGSSDSSLDHPLSSATSFLRRWVSNDVFKEPFDSSLFHFLYLHPLTSHSLTVSEVSSLPVLRT